jgi:2-iminobutanoate/2-iminopropanoate deaminase
VPFDPKTMELVKGEIEAEVTQAMQNMLAIVEAAGGDKGSILKTTVFVKDISLFGRINTVYEQVRRQWKL